MQLGGSREERADGGAGAPTFDIVVEITSAAPTSLRLLEAVAASMECPATPPG